MIISSYKGDNLQQTLDILQQAVTEVGIRVTELARVGALELPAIATVESAAAPMRDLKNPGEYDPNRDYRGGTYTYKMPVKNIVAAARAHLEKCWAKAQEIHALNAPALASNQILTERLTLQMRQLGFPEKYTEWVFATPRAAKKTEKTEAAGWARDLSRSVKTHDGFADAERKYKDQEQEIARFEREWGEKERAVLRAQEKAQEAKVQALKVALLATKYGLNGTVAERDDVLAAILAQDRYLALAHGLYRNRNNWNDGYHYAKNAVADFKPVNAFDAEVSAYLQDLIAAKYEQGDVDGRVFRDCEWNYDRLFGLVQDPGLKVDYDAICEGTDWA